MSVLQLRGVHSAYDGMKILTPMSFALEEGELVSVVGPSGCGKSTLLTIIAGLYPADGGEICFEGRAHEGVDRRIAYMPQDDLLLPWRTLLGNVTLPLQLRHVPKAEAYAQARAQLKEFGLQGFASAYPRQLSGGMRQRAALLRTVLAGAKLWLLDEPFGALDAITRAKMQSWLHTICRRHSSTVLLVTHDIGEALLLSKRILVLSARPAHILDDIHLPPERDASWAETPEGIACRHRIMTMLNL